MNKFEKDEMKHWKKEFYRTLDGTSELKQAKWVDHAKYLGNEAAAVVILSLMAFSVGAYLLGL